MTHTIRTARDVVTLKQMKDRTIPPGQ